jgi:ABC-type branched-subunit amino acid transport system substrate-binding protein
MVEAARFSQHRRGPLAGPVRTWRRFRRRPTAMQVRTIAIVIAIVAALVVWLGTAPKAGAATAPNKASTSARGVSAHSINVMFPVVDLNSFAGKFGFESDAEFGQQQTAVRIFVNQINRSGGINGRKINAIISTYDPSSESSKRALCKTWTEGSPAAFAVIDGIGAWEGPEQLCLTQEGHTPFLSQWSTVGAYTALGSPYLWWTGPDQGAIIKATVSWGLSAGLLGGTRKVGIIVGDRASDQLALNDNLLPALRAAHILPVLETIAADPASSGTTGTQAPLVVAKLKAAGVQSVIPLIPFNVFFPILQAQTQQQYYPKLLLSDYESSITSALGLIPTPYETALDGQQGITALTLGGYDDNRPESQGGYDTGVRNCYTIWHKAHPKPIPGLAEPTPFIEEQGPIQAWCGAIQLFAAAARQAGPNLNRRSFVVSMASIKNFPGTFSPVLSYGPNKFAGPIEYQVVKLHNNVPPSSACKLKTNHKPQGTCWVVVSTWQPLPTP